MWEGLERWVGEESYLCLGRMPRKAFLPVQLFYTWGFDRSTFTLITGALSYLFLSAPERTRSEANNLQLTKPNTKKAKPKENRKMEVKWVQIIAYQHWESMSHLSFSEFICYISFFKGVYINALGVSVFWPW